MSTTSQKNVNPCCGDDCCAGEPKSADKSEFIREKVREGYSRIARENVAFSSCCGGDDAESKNAGGGCCGAVAMSPEKLAEVIGYAQTDLRGVPDGANMGLSCGNPTALASLKPGETVLDLGAGGGFDCFIAGPKVGAFGRVIGVDMTPDMLSKARRNIDIYHKQTGLDNVEFRLGEIENLPVADNSVDVVISNCVLNLSPDKPRVWKEIARVLKPGGRVAVSDLALLRPLPEAVVQSIHALIGCVAGAVLIDEMRNMAENAGLVDIKLTPRTQYIDSLTNAQDPLYRKIIESLPAGTHIGEFVTSLEVTAGKPIAG